MVRCVRVVHCTCKSLETDLKLEDELNLYVRNAIDLIERGEREKQS